MLETPEERVKLLKAGFTGKTIEKLYIHYNNFKIVSNPDFIELIEFNILQNKRTESTGCDALTLQAATYNSCCCILILYRSCSKEGAVGASVI